MLLEIEKLQDRFRGWNKIRIGIVVCRKLTFGL